MRFVWTVLAVVAAFSFLPQVNRAQTEFDVVVNENSVGVYEIWKKHKAVLSQRFQGFIEYANEDTGELTNDISFFANYVSEQNQDQREKQSARGCRQGFFRCLTPGTTLSIEILGHEPLRTDAEKNKRNETKTRKLEESEINSGITENENKCECRNNNSVPPRKESVGEENWLFAEPPRSVDVNRKDSLVSSVRDSLELLQSKIDSLKNTIANQKISKTERNYSKTARHQNSKTDSCTTISPEEDQGAKSMMAWISDFSVRILGQLIWIAGLLILKPWWLNLVVYTLPVVIISGTIYENWPRIWHGWVLGEKRKHIGRRMYEAKKDAG